MWNTECIVAFCAGRQARGFIRYYVALEANLSAIDEESEGAVCRAPGYVFQGREGARMARSDLMDVGPVNDPEGSKWPSTPVSLSSQFFLDPSHRFHRSLGLCARQRRVVHDAHRPGATAGQPPDALQ